LQVCVFTVAADKIIVRAYALAATYYISLTTSAFAVLATGKRSALLVALAAVVVVIGEINALAPAPGKTFRAIGLVVTANKEELQRNNADKRKANPRHVRLRLRYF
jgi:hypothetical protein